MAQRRHAIESASSTLIIRSTSSGMNEAAQYGRPTPSMREPRSAFAAGSPSRQPEKYAECSGSATHSRVS